MPEGLSKPVLAVLRSAPTPCTCFDAVQSAIDIPVLHIADGIAAEIKEQPTLLLGTAYTMQKPFYSIA